MEILKKGLKRTIFFITGLNQIELKLLVSPTPNPSELRNVLTESNTLSVSDINASEDVTDIVAKITDKKEFNPKFKVLVQKKLEECIDLMLCSSRAFSQVQKFKDKKYDRKNKAHEEHLNKLWELLRPNQKLPSRITNDWQMIGFQADDPATDFRGPGVLGLALLYYCASFYKERSAELIENIQKLDSEHYFFFAISGINITQWLMESLEKNELVGIYDECSCDIALIVFFEIFSHALLQLGEHWIEEKKEMIQFNQIMPRYMARQMKRGSFREKVRRATRSETQEKGKAIEKLKILLK